MKQKRFLALILVLVLIFGMLAGCGSQKSDIAKTQDNSEPKTDSAAPSEQSYGIATTERAPEDAKLESKELPKDAKLIITANLSLETMEFSKAQAAIDALVSKYGGYFEASSTSSGSYFSEYNIRNASYTIRVPKESYKKFLGEMSSCCHVVDESESAQDVGEIYFDTELRLKTQKTKQERLLKLLEKAEKMEDIISLENALGEVQYQIEQYSSELKRYDNLVDFVTINASLQEVIKLSDVDNAKSGFFTRLKKAIIGGFEIAGEAIQELILSIAYCLPIIIVLGFFGVLALLLLRKRKRAKITNTVTPKEDNQDEKQE